MLFNPVRTLGPNLTDLPVFYSVSKKINGSMGLLSVGFGHLAFGGGDPSVPERRQ